MGTIRLYVNGTDVQYRHNGSVRSLPKGGEVSPGTIASSVASYMIENPPSLAWSGVTGKPDVFPPSLHAHTEYSNSTHTHAYEPANANIQGHVSTPHAPSNAQANADITKAEIEAKLTGAISTHSHAGGGGLGYTLQVGAANQATTTDSQTVYWGGAFALAQQTSSGVHRLYIPKAGTIRACYIYVHAGTVGTAENWTMNIRLNNAGNTLVQTLGLASATRVWSNAALNIAVVAGDYIEIQEVQPAWGTNPANIRRNGVIYIE